MESSVKTLELNNGKSENGFVLFYKKYQFFINLNILVLCFMANCFLPYFSYVAHVFCAICIIFSSLKLAISYWFFIFPYHCLLGQISIAMNVACLSIMLIKLLYIKFRQNKRFFRISRCTIILWVGFAVYLLLPIYRKYDLLYFLNLLMFVLIPVFMFVVIRFKEDFRFKYNLKLFLISLLFACLFTFFIPYSEHLKSVIPIFYGDGFTRFAALFTNPNFLAIVCELCLSFMLYYVFKHKAQMEDLIAFFIFTILGYFTLSKTFLIVSAVNLLILFVYMFVIRTKRIPLGFGCFLLLITMIILIYPKGSEAYIGRLFNFGFGSLHAGLESVLLAPTWSDILNKITTGRFDLWVAYVNALLESPVYVLFGRGLNAVQLHGFWPHNLYIHVAYQIGIVGVVLFVALIASVVLDALQTKKKPNLGIFAPILTFLMIGIVEW